MPTLYTEIEINAPRAVVWHALLHKENWLRWNTFLYDRNPDLVFQQGRKVQLSLRRLREETETEFEARVLLLQPQACLRWVSTAPGFRSEHVFELQDVGRNRVKYIHRELFSGLVTPLVLSFLRRDEQQGIRRMARELKFYLEGG
ncbi:MAG: SRPBCC family protein [Elainella sp.]